ncbi:MAG: BMC domain-containing protein [Lachnospiraceae bacterium]|nr:BMC domain-containing protein [Lachnospiraceae bacterium]MBQ1515727.1 BMC domain-containing protein [Lachnospiraceae bacterium]MCR5538773.1 BMC domain-containing protein [Lachnospiraceae bacterium]
MSTAIGSVELNSIASGIVTGDQMLKTASVDLVMAQPTCPGKYVILVAGETADVSTSVRAGIETGADKVVDSLILSNIDPQVISAITRTTEIEQSEAVGIIETFSLCASIQAADCAVKTANVELIEVRLGRGLGGKSYVILTGTVADVKSACDAVTANFGREGMLLNVEVVSSLHPDMFRALL